MAAKFAEEILLIVILLLLRKLSNNASSSAVFLWMASHKVVSFSGRKPDIPCFNGMLRGGGCSITLLGDVKDCGPRNNDFSDVEVGHILDLRTDLLTKEQFTRTFLFCFLTDGYRFQFFLDVFEEVSRAAESHMNNLLCMAENMAGRYMRHSLFFHSMCFDRY